MNITYEDSLTMPESQFEEVIDGELRVMLPRTKDGNAIIRLLQKTFDRQMREGLDLTWDTGFMIEQAPVLRYRIPDLAIVNREALLRDRRSNSDPYVRIAPELIVEVLSPSNRKGDIEKLLMDYADLKAGEVFVFRPDQRSFERYLSREGRLWRDAQAHTGPIRSVLLPEVEIDLDLIWAE